MLWFKSIDSGYYLHNARFCIKRVNKRHWCLIDKQMKRMFNSKTLKDCKEVAECWLIY